MSDELRRLIDNATVVHLQPDDIVVLRMAHDMLITPDMSERVRDAFAPRRVVVLAPGVSIGHYDGATHFEVGGDA